MQLHQQRPNNIASRFNKSAAPHARQSTADEGENSEQLRQCSGKRVAVFRKAAHNGSAYAVRPAMTSAMRAVECSAGGKSSARGVPGMAGAPTPVTKRSPATVDGHHRPGDACALARKRTARAILSGRATRPIGTRLRTAVRSILPARSSSETIGMRT
ncbi:hypothetical protein EV130_11910 [Rhizobium azibense]|uniref:Uncharacterized protein n=1 Tax=Rhizobium azibense TaxID=1136135 RepID=A0A4R3QDJ2_9HYPH|nr:hypothetical protein EV130_11910 [Rhizobium azibense]